MAKQVRGGLALILLGLVLYATAYGCAAWTGREGDANIGAGLLALLGLTLGAIGLLWLPIAWLDHLWRRRQERLRARSERRRGPAGPEAAADRPDRDRG